jgi:glycine betaine/proline transport system substrate-binding protein
MLRSHCHQFSVIVCALTAGILVSPSSVYAHTTQDAKTIRFGQPSWPGVTVKDAVASQILQSLGYKTEIKKLSPSISIKAIIDDEADVYFAGWMPMEKPLIDPMVEKGRVTKLVANLPKGAIQGIAVPTYVWKAGIHSVADMVKHRSQFDHKIYGIEAGSGFNVSVKEAIKKNKADLGDWTLVPSSTAAMLAQVQHSIQHKQWIAFSGWRPHWMNIKYAMKYLKDSDHSETAHIKSVVYTITRPDYAAPNPNLGRFLKQFKVSAKTQSKWIYGYSYQKETAETVARRWLKKHPDRLKKWLNGVKTVSGDSAIKAAQRHLVQQDSAG